MIFGKEYLINDEFVTFGYLFAIWSFRLILVALLVFLFGYFLGHWKENAQTKEFEQSS